MTIRNRRFVSNGLGMIVSQAVQAYGQRYSVLWLWFAVFSVASPQAFAAAGSERDITAAMMRQEARRHYTVAEGDLACAPSTASQTCVLQLTDRKSGQTFRLEGGDSSTLTREFLDGKRKSASIEGEMRASGDRILVRVSD